MSVFRIVNAADCHSPPLYIFQTICIALLPLEAVRNIRHEQLDITSSLAPRFLRNRY